LAVPLELLGLLTVKGSVHTEEGNHLDDSEQSSPKSCLIEKLRNKEENKCSAVDKAYRPKDHLDGEQRGKR
jgi:hypothetical protein